MLDMHMSNIMIHWFIAFTTIRTSHIVWYPPHLSQLNIINRTALFHSILLNAPQLLHFTFLYSALCRRLIFYHIPLINFITCFDKIICKLYLFNPNLPVNRSGLTCLFLNSDINVILLDPPFDNLIIFHIICYWRSVYVIIWSLFPYKMKIKKEWGGGVRHSTLLCIIFMQPL